MRPARRAALTCPACGGAASAVLSGAVEYDRCGRCDGVWLDRGELETLLALAHRAGKARAVRDAAKRAAAAAPSG